MAQIDFFARWPHFFDHMAPIYHELGDLAGEFFVSPPMAEYVWQNGIKPSVLKPRMMGNDLDVAPIGTNPLLTASVGDLQMAYAAQINRKFVLMEHGPGITFPVNSSYAGNFGYRRKASLFLAPNDLVYKKTYASMPEAHQLVIGTPMLDPWYGKFKEEKVLPIKPTVAIAFHWDGSKVSPEAGNTFRHYQSIIPKLAACPDFKLIAHGHPRNLKEYLGYYESLGIEVVSDFREVMNRANLLINDCSSIAYMFLVTGWPVILLNAPWFRKNVNFGLRFWDYTDVGEQVEHPDELFNAISRAFSNLEERRNERELAIESLFPHLGYSAAFTARFLKIVVDSKASI